MINGRLAGACLGIGLLSFGISLWSFTRNFEGGVTHEFCHYAEIGKNIVDGRGFRTRELFPSTLAFLDEKSIPFDADHWAPVLDRFPLQSYLTAAAESLGGEDDGSVAALSAFLLALCAAGTCAAGWALFGPLEGMLAGLFLATNPSFQRGFVLWGLPDFGFCLTVLLAVFLASARATGEDSKKESLWAFGSGAAAGLAWLARSNFILWLPLFFLAMASPKKGRSLRCGAYGTGFLLTVAPGWAYGLYWYGSIAPPTFSWNLAHYVVRDEYPLLCYQTFSAWDAIFHHFPALWRKFWTYLYLHLRDFPSLWQTQSLFPFIIFGAASETGWRIKGFEKISSMFFRGKPALKSEDSRNSNQTRRREFMRLYLAMLAVHLIVFSALRYERLGGWASGRYLLWWAPAAFLAAGRGIVLMGRRLRYPKMIPFALGAATLVWYASFLTAPQGAPAYPSGKPVSQWPEIEAAARYAGPRGLVATNIPAQMAWYGKVLSVWLPATPEDFLRLQSRHPVSVVLITSLPIGETNQLTAWLVMINDSNRFAKFQKDSGLENVSRVGYSLLLRPKQARDSLNSL